MSLWEKLDQAEMPKSLKENFTRIPEGTYTSEITDVEIREDIFSTSFSVEFTIDDGEFKGRKLWYDQSFTKDTDVKRLGYIKMAICKMAGVDSTDGKAMEILAGVKGNRCEIYAQHNPSKKDPSKIFVNPLVNGKI